MKNLQPIIKEIEELEVYVREYTRRNSASWMLNSLANIKKMVKDAEFTYMQGLRER